MSSNNEGNRTHFFTGRQVTTMVVSLMATIVLLPGAVWAVDQFTNVAIMDPVSGVKARVDSGRKLTVSDGSGLFTVDGSVMARPANPVDFVRYYKFLVGSGKCITLAAAPTGKAVVLTTIHFDVTSNPSPSTNDWFAIRAGTTCTGSQLGYVTPPGLGHTTLPMDPGLVSTTGFSIQIAGEPQADVTATGYLVPAAGLTTEAQEAAEAAEQPAPRR